MFQTLARFEETGLGLPYPVTLIDGAEAEIDSAGQMVGVAVPDLEGLAAAVAVVRCLHPLRLAGEEVRFIREVLNMTGRQLAEAVELDHATLSRWENGKQPVGAWAEKQLRYIAVLSLLDRVPGLHLNPKDAVGLPVTPRAPGEWPQITMRRVPVSEGSTKLAGWDRF